MLPCSQRTEGATPPTGQFTAQQVKHARDLRQAAKQKVLELSREEDEIDTNETGEKATADDDEGSPLPNNKGKGKKRGRKQPRGEDKNKMARTHELLGVRITKYVCDGEQEYWSSHRNTLSGGMGGCGCISRPIIPTLHYIYLRDNICR